MTNNTQKNRFLRGGMVMVVDDDPIIGKLLTRFLAEKNYEVTAFTSGKDALDYLESSSPLFKDCYPELGSGSNEMLKRVQHDTAIRLLLTDLHMPEMTGIELARQVKTLYPAMPIIVMSGLADGRDRDEIFSLGADFIPKPFDLAELLKRIEIPLL